MWSRGCYQCLSFRWSSHEPERLRKRLVRQCPNIDKLFIFACFSQIGTPLLTSRHRNLLSLYGAVEEHNHADNPEWDDSFDVSELCSWQLQRWRIRFYNYWSSGLGLANPNPGFFWLPHIACITRRADTKKPSTIPLWSHQITCMVLATCLNGPWVMSRHSIHLKHSK